MSQSNYLKDYLHFSGGNECPEPYRMWSALSLLASVLGRKVWTYHGRFQILPSLYVILVGDAGSGKSTAKNQAKNIFTHQFPNYLISASFQSHQDVIDQLCNAQPRLWEEKDSDGKVVKINSYTSFFIVSNEFASLLATDKIGMVNFLVDIYDENEFSTGFKGQRHSNPEQKQRLDNPYVNLLACAVPKWFMSNLKLDLFDGGLGRRLIIVYDSRTEVVPEPMMPIGGIEAQARVIEHLKQCEAFQGELHRTLGARNWWNKWYRETKTAQIDDPILQQFYQTKPVQVLKVAMLLSMSETPFTSLITEDHLAMAAQLITNLEPNVVKLTSGIGRNELAGVGAQVVDFVHRMGGASSIIQLRRYFNRYVNTPEFREILQHYQDTKEMFLVVEPTTYQFDQGILMTPAYHQIYLRKKSVSSTQFSPSPSQSLTPGQAASGSESSPGTAAGQESSDTPKPPASP